MKFPDGFKRGVCALAVLASGSLGATRVEAATIPSLEYQNFYLSYRYVPDNVQPGYPGSVPANELNLSYANGWTYGANFFSLDFEQFSLGDPSVTNPYGPAVKSNLGSSEFYSVFRTTFSGNKIFGGNKFAFGPVADVGLRLGIDYDVQNDQFGSYKRLFVAGPQFSIALPAGFWDISTEISHEWDTNGYAYPEGPATSFAPTYEIETAWLYPFNIGPVPLQFTGFMNIIGPKGRGYSEPAGSTGDFYHKMEILAHPKVLVDVGSLIHYKPGKLMAGVGYEFWMNKFGNAKPAVEGAQESTVFFEVGYNFD